ncbi:MAG: AmmeMemoRadiSam system radical SAM enzyme [Pseudomonadota bacterium]
MKEAYLYDRSDSGAVKCRLCRHGCRIEEGKTGICSVRSNQGGVLYSLVYDKLISANVDPIEKKPIFHMAPGSKSFSIATEGCNFQCSFCQNYSISQSPRDSGTIRGNAALPEQIVEAAVQRGCRSISYTYTEPTIFFELAYDTMVQAKKRNLMNVFVTNGYMSRDALDMAKGLLDAANVDLKAFSDEFYLKRCKARLEGVLDTLRYMKEIGIFVEVTTLLIPSLNDHLGEIRELAAFIKKDLGPETPWHISRFHPDFRETELPPTAVEALREAREVGIEEGLYYVYTGNAPGESGEKTHCPGCSSLLIDRVGYSIRRKRIVDGACFKCGRRVEGVEM